MEARRRLQVLKEKIGEPIIYKLYYPPTAKACIERARYMTESFKKTEGEPYAIRRAKAFANYLEKKTIFITEGELIVGNAGKDPEALPFYVEIMSAERIRKDIVQPYMLTAEGWKELEEILEYWKGKTLEEVCLRAFPEEVKRAVYPPEDWRTVDNPSYHTGLSVLIPDLDMLLSLGLNGIMKKVEARLTQLDPLEIPPTQVEETLRKRDQLNAMLIAGNAAIKLARRYSQLAGELGEKEQNRSRKAELEQIAENCYRVPAEPAETFWQALQAAFFEHIIDRCLEGPAAGLGQRFDQLFLPYYRKDVEAGRLTREIAHELLENLFLKYARQVNHIRPNVERERAQGNSLWQNITICGVDENGNDATNELSFLLMDVSKSVKTVQPSLSLRYHPRISDDVLMKAWELIKAGMGFPAFFNDQPMIAHLLSMGVSLEDARNVTRKCCVDIGIPGKNLTSKIEGFADLNVAKCLELALNDGADMLDGKQVGPKTGDPRQFNTYEDFIEAFRRQVGYAISIGAYGNAIYRVKQADLLQRPFGSLLFKSATERAEDITHYEDYELPWVVVSGAIDATDSVAAVKKLIFDEKKTTWNELLNALKANFEGHERLWQLCRDVPKWGSDDDYVDTITRDIFNLFNRELAKQKGLHGAEFRAMYQSYGVFMRAGKATAALPCGRRAGAPLADGGVSPEPGFGGDPIKVLRSVSKVDHETPVSLLLNQRLTPATTARQFINFIRAWGDMDIHHTQFNVFDVKTLRDAQAYPEKYPELMVRIAGYSALFSYLTKETQDAIIVRTEQSLTA